MGERLNREAKLVYTDVNGEKIYEGTSRPSDEEMARLMAEDLAAQKEMAKMIRERREESNQSVTQRKR